MKKRLLENIVKQHQLNHSKHDGLIRKSAFNASISPDIEVMFMNAYYKIKNSQHKGGWLESDIDLLMMNYSFGRHPNVFGWKEVPFDKAKLLLFEMKTHKTVKNENKGIYQLARSKNMIKDYTAYQNIDCIMAYGVGTGMVWEYHKEI